MDCSIAFLSNETLFRAAFEQDSLSPEAKKHIAQCELCQRQLARYKEIDALLHSSLYRLQCPTSVTLSSYCAQDLAEEERRAVEAHLLGCPLCTREVEDTLRFLAAVEDIA